MFQPSKHFTDILSFELPNSLLNHLNMKLFLHFIEQEIETLKNIDRLQNFS